MAYRMGEMAVLRASNPEQFVARLRESIQKHAGVMVHVAQDLDVGLSTAKRWVGEIPGLALFVSRLRKSASKARAVRRVST